MGQWGRVNNLFITSMSHNSESIGDFFIGDFFKAISGQENTRKGRFGSRAIGWLRRLWQNLPRQTGMFILGNLLSRRWQGQATL
jgi:hypothetical protein